VSEFERRTLEGGAHALVSTSLEREGFLAAFLERTGGQSTTPFHSMNASYSVGDDADAVAANRRTVTEAFGIASFAVPGLVHGTTILPVGSARAGDGFDGPAGGLASADGLYTRRARLPLAGFSADCVIAVMAEPRQGRVALVHAGWRGMAAGILQKAAALFDQPGQLTVAIGPAIGPCHYEVGEDVALAVAAGSPAGAVTEWRRGHLYLDLAATTAGIFRELGIRRVQDTALCTACQDGRLFSFRRDGATGRHLALAMKLA
jgi:YfiH family protein